MAQPRWSCSGDRLCHYSSCVAQAIDTITRASSEGQTATEQTARMLNSHAVEEPGTSQGS